jgi:hypothetical protein
VPHCQRLNPVASRCGPRPSNSGTALTSPSRLEDDLPRALVGGSVVEIVKQERSARDVDLSGYPWTRTPAELITGGRGALGHGTPEIILLAHLLEPDVTVNKAP